MKSVGVVVALVVLELLLSASGTRLRTSEDERALVVVASADEGNGKSQCVDCDASWKQPQVPEFEPTHEWKDILPNQALPPGLYIRVNLETGKKEAKLLD
ncbi:hypothetical protein PybrP1_003719 [[Pythium] brassicae (nom. inval.)]|nr:hypothetical protein PybrP1_003719 [[Pythium] brassicae (nom. inval.)]